MHTDTPWCTLPSSGWQSPGLFDASKSHQGHGSQVRTKPLQVLWAQLAHQGSHIYSASRDLPLADKTIRLMAQARPTNPISARTCLCVWALLPTWQLIHELSCSSMFKVIRLVAMAWLVAYTGSLGHFTAIVANFAIRPCIVQIHPSALSPSTATAAPWTASCHSQCHLHRSYLNSY